MIFNRNQYSYQEIAFLVVMIATTVALALADAHI